MCELALVNRRHNGEERPTRFHGLHLGDRPEQSRGSAPAFASAVEELDRAATPTTQTASSLTRVDQKELATAQSAGPTRPADHSTWIASEVSCGDGRPCSSAARNVVLEIISRRADLRDQRSFIGFGDPSSLRGVRPAQREMSWQAAIDCLENRESAIIESLRHRELYLLTQ